MEMREGWRVGYRRDPDLGKWPNTYLINNRIIKIEQIIISNSCFVKLSRAKWDRRDVIAATACNGNTGLVGDPGPAWRTHSFVCTARSLPWSDSRVTRVGSNYRPGVQGLQLLATTGGPLTIDLVSSSAPDP